MGGSDEKYPDAECITHLAIKERRRQIFSLEESQLHAPPVLFSPLLKTHWRMSEGRELWLSHQLTVKKKSSKQKANGDPNNQNSLLIDEHSYLIMYQQQDRNLY